MIRTVRPFALRRLAAVALLLVGTGAPAALLFAQRGVPRPSPAAKPPAAIATRPGEHAEGGSGRRPSADEPDGPSPRRLDPGRVRTGSAELYRRRQRLAATATAIEGARALKSTDQFAAAQARLASPAIDQHNPVVRYEAADLEIRQNAKLPERERRYANSDLFYDEINAQRKNATPEQRQHLEALATLHGGNEYLATHPGAEGTFGVITPPQRHDLSTFDFPRRINGRPIAPKKKIPDNAVIYIQANAGLNSRDWSPRAMNTVRTSIASGVEVLLLSMAPLSLFQPAILIEQRGTDQRNYVRTTAPDVAERLQSKRSVECRAAPPSGSRECPPIILVRKRVVGSK